MRSTPTAYIIQLVSICSILFLFACKGSSSNNESDVEDSKQEEKSIDLACEFCLYKDSVEQMEKQIAVLTATQELDEIDLYWDRLNFYAEIYDELLLDMQKTDLFQTERKESIDGVQAAYNICRMRYTFDKIKEPEEFDKAMSTFYMRQFDSFIEHEDLINGDTSLFVVAHDYYLFESPYRITKKISVDEFPEYWNQVQLSYRALKTHIDSLKTDICYKITGKALDEMQSEELLMLKLTSEPIYYADTSRFIYDPKKDSVWKRLRADLKAAIDW